ncbi:carboxylesterase/lipase family protein [Streptomyces sp. NPDC004838]
MTALILLLPRSLTSPEHCGAIVLVSEFTQGPQVEVEGGLLQGISSGDVSAFLGIPYAAAPFGERRMRPPQPVEPWSGVRSATQYGATAPKGEYAPQYRPLFPEVTIEGDECLNLNVWTPDPSATGLPVLVWIHGGAFMNGSGSVGEYDGTAFARDGVVCVTVNYRLAADGFLWFGDGTANLGMLDQVAALRWVRDNIAAFGGDPSRVTIAGESAGSIAVCTLLTMPAARGLFAQAIAQSGGVSRMLTPQEARLVGGYLADDLGVAPNREAIAEVPLDALVRAASNLIIEAQTGAAPERWGSGLMVFGPVVDGAVIPRPPLEAIADGRGGEIPLLIGTTRDEARLFYVSDGSLDTIDEATLPVYASGYGLDDQGLAVYRANRSGARPGDILAALVTDWYFRIPTVRVAEARQAAGTAGTWVYRFDHPGPEANGGLGACHGAEMPYVFGTTGLEDVRPRIGDRPSQEVADFVHSVWTSFVTHGEPGWSTYTADRRTTGLLDRGVTEADDPSGDERAVWDGIC